MDISQLQNNLNSASNKITSSTIKKILSIKNPNESIFLLMKNFYEIIKTNFSHLGEEESNLNEGNLREQSQSLSQSQNITWEDIQKNLSYADFQTYLKGFKSAIEKNDLSFISKEKLDKTMPFLANFNNFKTIFSKVNSELPKILEFLNIHGNYLVKNIWINNTYEKTVKKDKKIKEINSILLDLEVLIKRTQLCISEMEEDIPTINKQTVKTRNRDTYEEESKKEKKLNILKLIQKYGVDERYNAYLEIHHSVNKNYTIKLKNEYKDKVKFSTHVINSMANFKNGLAKEFDQKILDIVLENKKQAKVKKLNMKKIPLFHLGIMNTQTQAEEANLNIRNRNSKKNLVIKTMNNGEEEILSPLSSKQININNFFRWLLFL